MTNKQIFITFITSCILNSHATTLDISSTVDHSQAQTTTTTGLDETVAAKTEKHVTFADEVLNWKNTISKSEPTTKQATHPLFKLQEGTSIVTHCVQPTKQVFDKTNELIKLAHPTYPKIPYNLENGDSPSYQLLVQINALYGINDITNNNDEVQSALQDSPIESDLSLFHNGPLLCSHINPAQNLTDIRIFLGMTKEMLSGFGENYSSYVSTIENIITDTKTDGLSQEHLESLKNIQTAIDFQTSLYDIYKKNIENNLSIPGFDVIMSALSNVFSSPVYQSLSLLNTFMQVATIEVNHYLNTPSLDLLITDQIRRYVLIKREKIEMQFADKISDKDVESIIAQIIKNSPEFWEAVTNKDYNALNTLVPDTFRYMIHSVPLAIVNKFILYDIAQKEIENASKNTTATSTTENSIVEANTTTSNTDTSNVTEPAKQAVEL